MRLFEEKVEKGEILKVDSKDLNEITKCCQKFAKDFPTCKKLQSVHRLVNHSKHKRFSVETQKEKNHEKGDVLL